jgi:23S rRNA pseudouridine2604 synthase
MTDPIRLSKRLAELLPCSRREAELYIQGGWVLVDGQVVDEPQFKVAEQKIELLPGATPTPLPPVTLLLHLPAGVEPATAQQLLGPDSRWVDDPSGVRLLRGHFARLTLGVPIEPRASGLLVFTQDWRTVRKLTEDAAKLEQEYVVEVSGELAPHGLERLNRGLSYNGRPLPPCKVSWQSESRLRFALKNPQPGQIAHVCASVGLKVLGIKRIRIGGVPMAKLPVGQWRYLTPNERF